MKLTLPLLFVIIISPTKYSYSQTENSRVSFSLNFGMNNSTITNEYKPVNDWWSYSNKKGEESKHRLNWGLGIEYKLSNYFSIQSGFQISYPKSMVALFRNDTSVTNWKSVPVRCDVITKYRLINIPIDFKFSILNNNKFRLYIKCGVQTNSIMHYECVSKDTYYDGSTSNYSRTSLADNFSKFNFSMVGSVGFDYSILRKSYIGINTYYSHMLSPIKGDEVFWERHYTININDMGIKILFGNRF